MTAVENANYKHQDYRIRQRDLYAFTKYRIILDWLPKGPGRQVLNAGCGSGEMTVLLAQNSGWQVDAIDIDPEAIEQSRRLQREAGMSNIEIVHTSIENFAPGKQYDIIVSNDVLEHVGDIHTLVGQLHRLLKPDGLLYISVPAMQWLFGHHDEMLGHYRRYSRALLGDHLAPYFDIERWRYFGMSLIPIALLYSLILRKEYPVGQQTDKQLTGKALNFLLSLEYAVAWPLGTSLIAQATPRGTH